MVYLKWQSDVLKKAGVVTETQLYLKTLFFSFLIFGLTYFYLDSQDARNILNKTVADTSVILISSSMLLSSLCYFWNFVDTKIIYRKHLGLIGFAYLLIHIYLSLTSFLSLFKPTIWLHGTYWPLLTGFIALLIFTMMALISNKYSAIKLGGYGWRLLLRSGYIAVALTWIHVFLLKSSRIISWYAEGAKTTPPSSLFLLIFMSIVIIMRVLLWLSILKKKHSSSSENISSPVLTNSMQH